MTKKLKNKLWMTRDDTVAEGYSLWEIRPVFGERTTAGRKWKRRSHKQNHEQLFFMYPQFFKVVFPAFSLRPGEIIRVETVTNENENEMIIRKCK